MPEASSSLLKTPLTDWHRRRAARMVAFAGFEMPVQYPTGVLAEHAAVREKVGLFDITHMGEIRVEGGGAEAWLDGLVTNRIAGIAPGKVVYTAMCREDGGVLDDMLVYRLGATRWLVVCNAVNRAKIVAWLDAHAPNGGVTVSDVSDATALIAVQGPVSLDLLRRIPSLRETAAKIAALDFYESLNANVEGREWVVSRTGYTGERGYEIYVPSAAAPKVWDDLLTAGESDGALPIGLAARDTLRFEMAYCLYGHELSESITPLEAGIGWAVKLKKPGFIGQSALAGQKTAGVPRRLVGLEIDGKAIARQGARILVSGTAVGEVTSGNFSPTLKRPLALALVRQPLEEGDWAVEIRGKAWPCRIVPCPFIPARVKGDPRAERTGFI